MDNNDPSLLKECIKNTILNAVEMVRRLGNGFCISDQTIEQLTTIVYEEAKMSQVEESSFILRKTIAKTLLRYGFYDIAFCVLLEEV